MAALGGYLVVALMLWLTVYWVPTLASSIGVTAMLVIFYSGIASLFFLPIVAALAVSRFFLKAPT